MTGPRIKYKNARFGIYHILSRVETASCRQIIEMFIDADCGYFVLQPNVLAGKMRVWGYQLNRAGEGQRVGTWQIGPNVVEPEISRTMPRRFMEYLDRNHPAQ